MDEAIREQWSNLWVKDRQRQNEAFFFILEETEGAVDWSYEVWDEAVENLSHADNHNRAIAAQVLCNLAKSDPDRRMLIDFPALFAVTRDERFVTGRHALQAMWKVGAAGQEQQALLLEALDQRYFDCVAEKNCTLIRYDIIQSLRHVYDAVGDEHTKDKALALISAETDGKYRKKYAKVWKEVG